MLDSFIASLRLRIKRLSRPAKSRKELHDFWKDPEAGNSPDDYLSPDTALRSQFLVDLAARHCDPAMAVLEVGCNAGRNLDFLYRAGFCDLHAIEINAQALELLRNTFPEWAGEAQLHNRAIEDVLPAMDSDRFGLVFTMAVLEHIHSDSAEVFAEIARVTKDYLITIEDERRVSSRHFPRQYQQIFEPLGLQQIEATVCNDREHGLSDVHVARVFRKSR